MSRTAIKSVKLIDKKTMVLIKHSESAKDVNLYGNLFEVIKDKESLTNYDLLNSSNFDLKAKSVIQSKMKILKKNITEEWYATTTNDEANGKVHCKLCNQPNTLVFYITNRLNGNELNVGSTCVADFPNIENVKILKRNRLAIQKEYEKDKRNIEFGEVEIEEPLFLENIINELSAINIMLPYNLSADIEQLITDIRNLKTNYIQKGGDLASISKDYYEFKTRLKQLLLEANIFYDLNKGKKLICDKNLSDWLKAKNYSVWKNIAENNGLLDIKTLEFAYNDKYMGDKIDEFISCLDDKTLSIINIDVEAVTFHLKDKNYIKPIEFYISNNDFMKTIGAKCIALHNYKFTVQDLTNYYFIQNTNTFYLLKERMSNIMKKVGFDIIKSEYSDTYYFKVLNMKKNNATRKIYLNYKKINISIFFKYCTRALFLPDNQIERTLKNYYGTVLMVETNWKSEKQIKDEEQFSRDLAINERREFI